tara:strand:- start:62 stop:1078 length:1017 start_codon:yes stop_codon:yes gene_type:complete
LDTLIYKHRNLITFGIPLFLILSVIILASSSVFQLHPKALSIGIIFDLVLVIPAIYFLLIRKRKIPKITTIPFFIAGIVIASIIIPKDFQFYLTQVKNWVLPIVETTVFFLIIYKVRQLNKIFKKERSQDRDFYSALKSATAQLLPKKLSVAFSTEIAVIYYGFFNWKNRKLSKNEFSYHKSSGTIALLLVFIFLILVETSVVHLLLQKWSILAAWILSILSIYTCIQVFGIMRSMSKRPISIDNGELKLRYGLFSESTISISNIEEIELSTKSIELDDTTKKLSPLGDFESHNVVIKLKEEEVLFGLYGLISKYNNIALYVDEKEYFKNEINNALQQ